MKSLPFAVFVVLLCVASGCSSGADVDGGEDAGLSTPADAGGDPAPGGGSLSGMELCGPSVIRPGESVYLEALPYPFTEEAVVKQVSVTGPCSVEHHPGSDVYTFGVPFVLGATGGPGSCDVDITLETVLDSGTTHTYRGSRRIEVEEGPALRKASRSPVDPSVCNSRDLLEPDVPMLVDGTLWCRSDFELSVFAPGASRVRLERESVAAVVDATTVLTRDRDESAWRLRDASGGLLADLPAGPWQSDGRGRLVRVTKPEADLVRLEWFTVVGEVLTSGVVEDVPMRTDGPVRYWSGALLSVIPETPGNPGAVGWRFHDRTSGEVLHEVEQVDATAIIALDALVLDDRLYTSLDQLRAGTGVLLPGSVVVDGHVEGARRFVTAQPIGRCSGTAVALHEFDGAARDLGRGYVYNWEGLTRLVAYDRGILFAETYGWRGYLTERVKTP